MPAPTQSPPSFLSSVVSDVTLRSQFTPSYTWTPVRQTATQGGFSDAIMSVIRPSADIRMPNGATFTVAPWGSPEANYFPILALGVVAMGVLVAGGLIAIGKRLGK